MIDEQQEDRRSLKERVVLWFLDFAKARTPLEVMTCGVLGAAVWGSFLGLPKALTKLELYAASQQAAFEKQYAAQHEQHVEETKAVTNSFEKALAQFKEESDRKQALIDRLIGNKGYGSYSPGSLAAPSSTHPTTSASN